jgi:uncharacterized membrane protein YjfL (UPF0719 family)
VKSTESSLSQWIRCVFWTTLLVGVADYAIGFGVFVAALGAPPLRILQHPASGILGRAAYEGGIRTAALGIALHFLIALIWSVIYISVYQRLPALRRFTRSTAGLLAAAAVAGVIVWLVMNNIVLPLSHTRPYSVWSGLFWVILAGHIPFVGLPLAWSVRRFSPMTNDTSVEKSEPQSDADGAP